MSSDPAMTADEKAMRRSFRIRENAFIHYQKLSNVELEDLISGKAARAPSRFRNHSRFTQLEARFNEAFVMMGQAPSAVRECFSVLNEKLNLLLEEQPDRQEAIKALTANGAYTCEIGSTGIRFDSEEPLEEGQAVFIQVMLTADNHYLETAAVVRRLTEPMDDDPLRTFGVGLEFVGFDEAESELLIKHLFQRESETLRMRRLNLD